MSISISWFLRRVLEIGQRFKFSVVPNHFYSEIPDVRQLRRDRRWMKPFSMVEVKGTNIDAQFEFVREVTESLRAEIAKTPHESPNHFYRKACERNGEAGYGPTEAEFLHCFIRARKPARIVQVGCGVSTALIQDAAAAETGYSPKITCVEPYPTAFLRAEQQAGRITLMAEPAQWVDRSVFTSLGPGDLLFIDSTHTVKVGSEVPRMILEVLPRLAPGVIVHFHDIPFPHDYMQQVMKNDVFFIHEPVLLHAFLSMNRGYRILASFSMLQKANSSRLKTFIPNFVPSILDEGVCVEENHFPSALYLERTEQPS